MLFRYTAACVLLAAAFPALAQADTDAQSPPTVDLELNTITDTDSACRLSFVAHNRTTSAIDKVVFETVIFDGAGGVATLSLFDFRDLPQGRPRVRQFDVPGIPCASIARVLINGANTCTAAGAESDICDSALSTRSRIDVELLG
ncbi:hypothetical protein [uncultured Tateyamaria sp.]|uniref:hypothetical protein n=1 Tax=uncultured Tateyamaria sp. TaxID=455651 RepID=UPI002604515A|nr:hypothetical protein [uncultured Tateyamaria sp.]